MFCWHCGTHSGGDTSSRSSSATNDSKSTSESIGAHICINARPAASRFAICQSLCTDAISPLQWGLHIPRAYPGRTDYVARALMDGRFFRAQSKLPGPPGARTTRDMPGIRYLHTLFLSCSDRAVTTCQPAYVVIHALDLVTRDS